MWNYFWEGLRGVQYFVVRMEPTDWIWAAAVAVLISGFAMRNMPANT